MDSCLAERRSAPQVGSSSTIDDRRELKLRDENITSVVWAAGYRFSYEWLDLPILDSKGAPVQERGVTACPGVYFLGLHWMRERMRASPKSHSKPRRAPHDGFRDERLQPIGVDYRG